MLPGDEKNYVLQVSFNTEAVRAAYKASRNAVTQLQDVTPLFEQTSNRLLFVDTVEGVDENYDLVELIKKVRGVEDACFFPRGHLPGYHGVKPFKA